MEINKILLYATYLVAIAAFIVMFIKLRPAFKFKRTKKTTLELNRDARFVKAVQIAMQHGEVNHKLIARRLKISRDDAEDLIAKLHEKHIIAPANDRGVSEVIN